MKLKKGHFYTMVDPKEFIEDGEGFEAYRDLKINEEVLSYIFDDDKFGHFKEVVFHTKESLIDVCEHFYRLGLERKLELHPEIPIERKRDYMKKSDIRMSFVCAWNHIIEKDQIYLCTRDFEEDGQKLYIEGKIYKSERDGCLTDEIGNKNHFWPAAEDRAHKYFRPASYEEIKK